MSQTPVMPSSQRPLSSSEIAISTAFQSKLILAWLNFFSQLMYSSRASLRYPNTKVLRPSLDKFQHYSSTNPLNCYSRVGIRTESAPFKQKKIELSSLQSTIPMRFRSEEKGKLCRILCVYCCLPAATTTFSQSRSISFIQKLLADWTKANQSGELACKQGGSSMGVTLWQRAIALTNISTRQSRVFFFRQEFQSNIILLISSKFQELKDAFSRVSFLSTISFFVRVPVLSVKKKLTRPSSSGILEFLVRVPGISQSLLILHELCLIFARSRLTLMETGITELRRIMNLQISISELTVNTNCRKMGIRLKKTRNPNRTLESQFIYQSVTPCLEIGDLEFNFIRVQSPVQTIRAITVPEATTVLAQRVFQRDRGSLPRFQSLKTPQNLQIQPIGSLAKTERELLMLKLA